MISIIISKIYIKIALSVSVNGIKKGKRLDKSKAYIKRNTLISYLKKEFICLNRNPIFFMQCVLPTILFPIIVAIPIYMTFIKYSSEEIQTIVSTLQEFINKPIGLIASLIIILFFFMFNFASVTCVSRDGENSTFMKYIPVRLNKQIIYKTLPGILLNIIPIVYVTVFSKIFIQILQIKTIIYFVFISILINICNNFLMIIVDFKNPKLNWITEYAVVKQNFNMFFEIMLIIIEGLIIVFVNSCVYSVDVLAIILSMIFLVLDYLIFIYIRKNEEKLFYKIY